MMKRGITVLVSILMAFLVSSLAVIHKTNNISKEIIHGDIPEKPVRIEELPSCIDVTSRIRKPIELVREKAYYENRNIKVNLAVEEIKRNQAAFLANAKGVE